MHQPVSEIYHIRLNSGEDLISEVQWPETKPGHEDHIVLHNPMKIICVPSGKPGYVSLSLMQWIFTKISSDQQFNIFSRDILTMSRPNPNLKEYYKETVDYFNKRIPQNTTYEDDYTDDELFNQLEKEINAVSKSDRIVEEESEDMDSLRDIVNEFLNSLSANNKGTLH